MRGGRGGKTRRRRAERRGRWAEGLVLLVLRVQGFRLRARRLRTPVGEIDLLVRRGRLWLLVEVKWRSRFEAEVLSARQLRRLERAGQWCRGRLIPEGDDLRLDLVVLGAQPRWVKNLTL